MPSSAKPVSIGTSTQKMQPTVNADALLKDVRTTTTGTWRSAAASASSKSARQATTGTPTTAAANAPFLT